MRRLEFAWPLLLLWLLLAGCQRLESPEQSGLLLVGITADPVFYQEGDEESPASGFEYDLVSAFAEELGVAVRFVVVASDEELRALLLRREIHFAAAMPVLHGDAALRFTPPLREARQVVVRRADAVIGDGLASLAGRTIEILPGAPQYATLTRLTLAPAVVIEESPAHDALELMARVSGRLADLIATDELHFDVATNFYPDLAIAAELPETNAYAWAFHFRDEALRARATAFLERASSEGLLARLHDRYFGHVKRLTTADVFRFLEDVQALLPRYQRLFQQAELLHGIDWRLVAALAYQESRWNPLATSPTGVRGMMMLTAETADRLGVGNRLDASESILAGTRYLADLIAALPAEVPQPDRTWMALAAYNLGLGHLNGGRAIARSLQRDPNSWYEMKHVLPQLSRPEIYRRLKSGRARGGEAVILVENVRNYYDILSRFAPPLRRAPGSMMSMAGKG